MCGRLRRVHVPWDITEPTHRKVQLAAQSFSPLALSCCPPSVPHGAGNEQHFCYFPLRLLRCQCMQLMRLPRMPYPLEAPISLFLLFVCPLSLCTNAEPDNGRAKTLAEPSQAEGPKCEKDKRRNGRPKSVFVRWNMAAPASTRLATAPSSRQN
ncbi:hypothetical protein K437DRAFT_53021 [Tilletiaria anomala UBC 951]|uniref:Uncharacterized protein n=1 Tax=Tilletiaria anomala (strain ATCC 24038 / CBS 436.72 / UBC 951) TaxID=1037660 RepID=A0A066V4E1_TILAU|nr:uncharacterized protein K437DRAFT_53021 [Tilletiaria anomala UBC 951]KDN36592.1 hypothetical protein K437DRAFT_53021 [Tilletiaria anomala UBC 951]